MSPGLRPAVARRMRCCLPFCFFSQTAPLAMASLTRLLESAVNSARKLQAVVGSLGPTVFVNDNFCMDDVRFVRKPTIFKPAEIFFDILSVADWFVLKKPSEMNCC